MQKLRFLVESENGTALIKVEKSIMIAPSTFENFVLKFQI